MMLLPFQANADRRGWFGFTWFHGRCVRIVALCTAEYDPFTLPATYPLSMTAVIPVPLTIGMAGTANDVRPVDVDFLVTRGAQKTDIFTVMAGQAPEPVAAVVDFAHMPCSQPAGFRVRIPFLVAFRTVVEFRT